MISMKSFYYLVPTHTSFWIGNDMRSKHTPLSYAVSALGTSIRSTCFQPCQEYVNFRPYIHKIFNSIIGLSMSFENERSQVRTSIIFFVHFSCFFLSNLLTNRPKFCCLLPAFNFIGPALLLWRM